MKRIINVDERLFFLIFFTLAIFLRLIFLNVLPPALANDEANVILNAQSLINTGKNIPGVVTGVFGLHSGETGGGIHSEFSSYFLALIYLISGFSQTTARLPFVVAGVGVVVFLYLIADELFGKKISKIVLVLAVVNPWMVQFSRSGYEAIIAAFFYLISIYLFLKNRGWKIFYSLPFLLFGFFSYFSAKTLLLPITFSFLVFALITKNKENVKPVISLNILTAVFLFLYFLALSKSPAGARIAEFSPENFSNQVNYARTHSVDFPLAQFIENKAVENLIYRIKATLGGASLSFLFIDGVPESSGHLQIPQQGPMYLIDLFFVFVGFIFLARRDLKKLTFLLLLVAASFLPNFFDIANSTYSMRPVLLIPMLILFSAYGIVSLLEIIKNKKFRVLAVLATAFIYLFFFTRFIFQYYYRLPIEENDTFFFQDKIATNYIRALERVEPSVKVVWVTPSPKFTFYRFIFFGDYYKNSFDIKKINLRLASQDYSFGNVLFQSECPKEFSKDSLYLVDATMKCRLADPSAIVANINDAGVKYQLSRDPLCAGFGHRRYPLIKEFNLLRVESLSIKDFCDNYVISDQLP